MLWRLDTIFFMVSEMENIHKNYERIIWSMA